MDTRKISEGPMTKESVQAFSGGGWALFVEYKDEWRSLYLDGDNGIIRDEKTAREMYELAVKDPACESATLVRIQTVAGFNRAK